MKALLKYASDYRIEESLEINSLDDILKLLKEKGDLVIRTDFDSDENAESLSEMIAKKTEYLHITVYDDYIE